MSNETKSIEKQKETMPALRDYSQLIRGNTTVDMIAQIKTIAINGALTPSKGLFSLTSKEDKFAKEVTALATSDDVLSKLDSKLGSPKKEETEEEFVNRGKDILRNILRDILNQK